MATYEYSGSGDLTLGGEATTSTALTYEYLGKGDVLTDGEAVVVITKVYIPAASGANFGGHATKTKTKAFVGSEGLIIDEGSLSGAITEFDPIATTVIGDYAGDGSISFDESSLSGALTEVGHENGYFGSGGLVTGGTVDPVIITKDYTGEGGSLVSSPSVPIYSLTKVYPTTSGGIVFDEGSLSGALTELTHVTGDYTGSGGLTTGGTAAPIIITKAYTGSDGLTLGGSATITVNTIYTYTPSGGLVTGGSALVSALGLFSYIGSGALTFGGTADPIITVRTITPSGGLVTGGTFSRVRTIVRIGECEMILGGAAVTGKNGLFDYSGTGGLTLGGDAATNPGYVYYYTGSGGLITLDGECFSIAGRGFLVELVLFSKKFPPRLIFLPDRPAIHLPGHRKYRITASSDVFKFCNTAYPDLKVVAMTDSRDNESIGIGGSASGGSALHSKTKAYSTSNGMSSGGAATTSLET